MVGGDSASTARVVFSADSARRTYMILLTAELWPVRLPRPSAGPSGKLHLFSPYSGDVPVFTGVTSHL